MNKLYLIIAALFVLASCTKEPASFQINGSVTGLTEGKAYLMKLAGKTKVKVDSTEIKDGKFLFKGNVLVPDLYLVKVADQNQVAGFFLENSPITITFHIDSIDKAEIKGSSSNEQYLKIKKEIAVYDIKSDSLYKLVENAADTTEKARLEKKMESLDYQKKGFLEKYVAENKSSSVAAYIAMRELSWQLNLEGLDKLVTDFDSTLKSTNSVTFLKDKVEKIKNVQPGKIAPDFALTDTAGTAISMSSFKGKYLLLEFWASWCSACRAGNPELVKIYKEYNKKGFEILGVSLDDKKGPWIDAIKSDKLSWANVSDLKGRESEGSKLYGVIAIPTLVLIDKEGIILDYNISKKNLRTKLTELLK